MIRLKLVPENTKLNFMGPARFTFGLSLVLVVLSLVAFFSIGLNFGIDFRGGTSIRTESTQAVDVGAYRAAIAPLNVGDVAISEVFDPSFGPDRNVAMVRIQAQDGAEAVSPETLTRIEGALRAMDPELRFSSVESVGPKVSGELVQQAFLAVGVALLGILFYIWLRFEWQFAVGAVAALVHDVILTIGIFTVLQLRFDLAIIAALLTIVGYSINDTVIVFDRVRENLSKLRGRSFHSLINHSISEMLNRTLLASGTTVFSLGGLFFFGTGTLKDFALTLIVGIVLGTYSSIYVALPLTEWLDHTFFAKMGKAKKKIGEARKTAPAV